MPFNAIQQLHIVILRNVKQVDPFNVNVFTNTFKFRIVLFSNVPTRRVAMKFMILNSVFYLDNSVFKSEVTKHINKSILEVLIQGMVLSVF